MNLNESYLILSVLYKPIRFVRSLFDIFKFITYIKNVLFNYYFFVPLYIILLYGAGVVGGVKNLGLVLFLRGRTYSEFEFCTLNSDNVLRAYVFTGLAIQFCFESPKTKRRLRCCIYKSKS